MHKQWLGVWVHDPHDADHLEHHQVSREEAGSIPQTLVVFPPTWPYTPIVRALLRGGASADFARSVGVEDKCFLTKYTVLGVSSEAVILADSETQALHCFAKLCCGLDRVVLENPYEMPCA